MPPPTQGVTALEALRIVDGLDLGADGPDREHLLIEAMKLALADRDAYLGDPDAMTIDAASDCSPTTGSPTRRGRDRSRSAPRRSRRALEPDGGTIYMCAADRDGMLVSLIQSNFFGAGSGLRVGEWGINLHNRGSAFVLDDAHPNGIGPRKMPLHTLIPALAMRDGRPWLVFGSEGGHGQAQTHTQLLVADARRRRRPAARDQRAALHDRSRARGASRWRITSIRRGSTTCAAAATRSTSCAGYRHGPGIAHAIECTRPGYRCGSDPRAEGGSAGL